MSPAHCRHCKTDIAPMECYCPSCGVLQPLPPVDYFTLLGIETQYTLEMQALEHAYLALQKQFHPDRFVNRKPEEKILAAQYAAEINAAYETLKHPRKRAEYILKQEGISLGDSREAVKPSQELLLETLELREQLQEVAAPSLPGLLKAADNLREETISAITAAYRDKDYPVMAQAVLRLGYLDKYREEIARKK